MNRKFKSVVLDADIVIKLHEKQLWAKALNHYDLSISSIVISEVQYFEYDIGGGTAIKYINLESCIEQNALNTIELDASEVLSVYQSISCAILPELDPGETETISAVFLDKVDGLVVCLNDAAAVEWAVLLGLKDRCICFPELIKPFSYTGEIPIGYAESRFRKIVQAAETKRVQFLL